MGMGLDQGLLKKLLLVACILGVLQGVLTFIGGLVACFDRNKDLDNNDVGRWIGDVRLNFKDNGIRCTEPICDCNIDKSDRGWFYRTHKYCKKSGSECASGEDAFNLVMTYAIAVSYTHLTLPTSDLV
eukprot:TRINITY_DN39_c0_g3_i1.p1 TRINITY_DN39_c0_g3~~TRINITY_DN39_c0_g3_i1.p1  ORF type:complete len:128 (-),score=16.13 TRINITY_DN39_c0_g3_i1:47-430(-)